MKKALFVFCYLFFSIQAQKPYTVSIPIPQNMQKAINKQPCTFDCDTLNIHFSEKGVVSTTVSASQAPDEFFKQYDISKIFLGVIQEEYKKSLPKTKAQIEEQRSQRMKPKELYCRVYCSLELEKIGPLLEGLNGKAKKGYLEYLGRELVLSRKLQGGSYYLTPHCTHKKSMYSCDSNDIKKHYNEFLKGLYQRFIVVNQDLSLLLRKKDITLVKESDGTFVIGRKGDGKLGLFDR